MKKLLVLFALATMSGHTIVAQQNNKFTFHKEQAVKDFAMKGETILSVENTTASISETLIDKIKVKIRNKSGKSQDIYYTNANGGGKTTGTLSANSTQTISIEPGGKVYTKQGVLLLTVTAIMAGSEQTIIK